MISIRDETPNDHAAIRSLTIAAFEGTEWGHSGEAELIDSIRQRGHGSASISPDSFAPVSLVADLDGQIVGHILFSELVLRNADGNVAGMALGPMAVLPTHQGKGVGTELILKGLVRLRKSGVPFVGVVGSPDYYGRSGFQLAKTFSIRHGFEGIPQEVFLFQFLGENSATIQGDSRAYYVDAFGKQFQAPTQSE